jgi:hypothetical protein
MKKTLFLLLVLSVFALAQPSVSISGSFGYILTTVNEASIYDGTGFDIGVFGLIPLTDIAKFGIEITIGHYSVSYNDAYAHRNIGWLYLDLAPGFRFEQDKKTYADIFLSISKPLYGEVETQNTAETFGFGDTDTDFGIALFGRYKFIGIGIGKVFTGSNAAIAFGANAFISLSEHFEIIPSVNYSTGEKESSLRVFAGIEYTL